MRTVSFFALIWICTAATAQDYLPQSTHIRNLLFEPWTGSYIESTMVGDLGSVRFDFCQSSKVVPGTKDCHRLHRPELRIHNLPFYQTRLVAGLRGLRREMVRELDSGLFSSLAGGSKGDSNIQALDEMIEEIERENLYGWLHVMDENHDIPKVSNLRVSKRIAEVFRRVFETPAPGQPGTAVVGQAANGF